MAVPLLSAASKVLTVGQPRVVQLLAPMVKSSRDEALSGLVAMAAAVLSRPGPQVWERVSLA
jgi:hypothetical protein